MAWLTLHHFSHVMQSAAGFLTADWMCRCVDVAEPMLPLFEPQHISMALWALAKTGFHPGTRC